MCGTLLIMHNHSDKCADVQLVEELLFVLELTINSEFLLLPTGILSSSYGFSSFLLIFKFISSSSLYNQDSISGKFRKHIQSRAIEWIRLYYNFKHNSI